VHVECEGGVHGMVHCQRTEKDYVQPSTHNEFRKQSVTCALLKLMEWHLRIRKNKCVPTRCPRTMTVACCHVPS
jgi:hypothetical protein